MSSVDKYLTLLDAASAAVLTTYRKDGAAVTSPVWFQHANDGLEVVIAENDLKLRHLAARPQCSLVVFETVPPFRGVRVAGTPTLRRDGVAQARQAIASRYLGAEQGDRFTATRGAGVILWLPIDSAQMWDLKAILPT